MVNCRTHRRTLIFMTGKLNIPGSSSIVDCAVLDVSERGACILVPDAAAIPTAFGLTIDRTNATYQCCVRWKKRNRIGVSFQSTFDTAHVAIFHNEV